MKTIINYSTSGMGNRLRPLSSCYAISKKSGRQLKAYWDNITTNGCLARFDELFENDLDVLSLEDLSNLDDCLLLTESGHGGHGIDREVTKFGRTTLKELSLKNPYRHYESFSYDDKQKNVIIYHNNFLPTVDKKDCAEFLINLKPIKKVQQKIDHYVGELGLNKNVIGVHARGTDFGAPLTLYVNAIKKLLEQNPKQKIFLSTEDPDYENVICDLFSDSIILRKKENYIVKKDSKKEWNDHTSFAITTEVAQEGLEDIYLLAHTNILIYHPLSSFAEISRVISQKY